MASYQYVYVMKDLTKAFPGGREVFKGITLSFLPGVKIGVLGINGAGKSTLLKIMAGIETEFGGEAWAAEGVRVGYLAQEPQLDPTKTVAENVAEAFGPLKAALARFNEISDAFAEPMTDDEMNDLLAEQAELQEKIDAEDGWDLDRRIEIALDALRCPPPDADVTSLSGGERRRVALCRLLLRKARHPAARRADQPSRRRIRRLARTHPARLSPAPSSSSPTTATSSTTSPTGSWKSSAAAATRSRATTPPGWSRSASACSRKRKRKAARQRALAARAGMDSRQPAARARPRAAPASSATRRCCSKSQEMAAGVAEIVIPPGPRLGGHRSSRPKTCAKATATAC